MARTGNPPQAELTKIKPEKVKAITADLLTLHRLGRCESDQEIEERIDEYFQLCQQTSIRPGIESLACALHTDRMTLWRWAKGEHCSERRAEAIRAAKSLIGSFLEQAGLQGQLNPATQIFLAKNWLGYRDVQEIEVSRPDPLAANLTPEQIAKRIEADIPIDGAEPALIEDHGTNTEMED